MDGAGWHRSKDLKIPKNLEIFLLPPYSPELNPVERFWLHMKKSILNNKLYDSLSQIEDEIEKFLANIDSSSIASICKVNYLIN